MSNNDQDVSFGKNNLREKFQRGQTTSQQGKIQEEIPEGQPDNLDKRTHSVSDLSTERSRRIGSLASRETVGGYSGARRNSDQSRVTHVDVGRRRAFSSNISVMTDEIAKAFDKLLEIERAHAQYSDEGQFKINVLTRDRNAIPYDTIVLSQKIGFAGGQEVAYYYSFIIAASRGELEKIQFDNRTFSLPNVCGDTPDDNNRTIDIILNAIEDDPKNLFGTTQVVNSGERVIESQAVFTDDLQSFNALLSDGAEAIRTMIENSSDEIAFDWTEVATGESGRAVVNSIEYQPEALKSATGMPIHRHLVLRTSGFEQNSLRQGPSETRVISELSAFIDFRYGVGEREDDPCWLPTIVFTDFKSESGGNVLELMLIGLANAAQLREDYQYLPAISWRNKNPKDDIGNFGYVEPSLFGLDKPAGIEVNSVDDLHYVAKKAIVPSLEFCWDVSNTDSQSWLAGVIGGAVAIDSEEYKVFIKAADSISGNHFSALFFDDRNPDAYDEIVIDSDNFQIGGYYLGPDHERRDVREVGHIAVINDSTKDLERLREYDYSVLGGTDLPARNLYTQLKIKEEIVDRITVTSYIRRYTFSPWFMDCLARACAKNYMVSGLDGAVQGPTERRQFMEDLRRRGLAAERNYGRRSSYSRR